MLIQVGELARRAGMTVRTLHHYEQTGLLMPSASATTTPWAASASPCGMQAP